MNHSLSPSITLSDQSVYSGTSEGPRSNKALIAAIDPYLKKYKSGPESTLSLKQVSELPEYRILKDNFIVAKNRLCYVKRELSKKRASEVKKSPVQSELFTPNNFSPLPLRDFHSPQYEVDRILSSPVPQVIYRPIQSITPPATRNQLPSTPSWENTVLWSSPVSHAIYQPVKSITAPPRKQVTSTPDWENTLSKRLLEVRIEDMSPLEYLCLGSFKLCCTHPERNYGNLHCVLSHAHTGDANGTRSLRVEVLTVFYPVYHPHDLDKISCVLDDDGAGFTVTEASSPYFFNSPEIMGDLHADEHGSDFYNLATTHLVQVTDISETARRQLKQTRFTFPDRPDGETGVRQIICNDKYWNNENKRIDSFPLSCVSTFTKTEDTINYFVRWTFTVESAEPHVVKKAKALTTSEKMKDRLQGKAKAAAALKAAYSASSAKTVETDLMKNMMSAVPKRNRDEDYYSDDDKEERVEKSFAYEDFELKDWRPVLSRFEEASDEIRELSDIAFTDH